MTLLMIGTTELLLVAGLVLLLFGGKKLPEMMKGMGQGVKSFKEGLNAPVEEPQKKEEAPTDKSQPEPSGDAKEIAQHPEQ